MLALLCPPVQSAEPVRLVDDCLAQVEPAQVGLPALEERCPGLTQALPELTASADLPPGWDATLGFDMLEEIASLHRHFDRSPAGARPDAAAIHAVLDEYTPEAAGAAPTPWQRFRAWVERLLRGGEEADSSSWFNEWWERQSVPGWAGKTLFYLLISLVLMVSIYVIGREVRAAREGREARQRSGMRDLRSGSGGHEALSVSLIEQADLTERPQLYLRLLVRELVRLGRLRPDRSLTHSELAGAARFEATADLDAFGQLAQVAERQLYGGGAGRDRIEEVLARAREVHARLERSVAPP